MDDRRGPAETMTSVSLGMPASSFDGPVDGAQTGIGVAGGTSVFDIQPAENGAFRRGPRENESQRWLFRARCSALLLRDFLIVVARPLKDIDRAGGRMVQL